MWELRRHCQPLESGIVRQGEGRKKRKPTLIVFAIFILRRRSKNCLAMKIIMARGIEINNSCPILMSILVRYKADVS